MYTQRFCVCVIMEEEFQTITTAGNSSLVQYFPGIDAAYWLIDSTYYTYIVYFTYSERLISTDIKGIPKHQRSCDSAIVVLKSIYHAHYCGTFQWYIGSYFHCRMSLERRYLLEGIKGIYVNRDCGSVWEELGRVL